MFPNMPVILQEAGEDIQRASDAVMSPRLEIISPQPVTIMHRFLYLPIERGSRGVHVAESANLLIARRVRFHCRCERIGFPFVLGSQGFDFVVLLPDEIAPRWHPAFPF